MRMATVKQMMPLESRYSPAEAMYKDDDGMHRFKYGVRHRYQLTVQTSTKIFFGLAVVATVLLLAIFLSPWFVLAGLFVSFGAWVSWCFLVTTEMMPLRRGLSDEIKDVHETLERLVKLQAMIPEGSENLDKIDEYGRLAFEAMRQVDLLPSETGGKHTNSFRIQNQVQQELRTLVNAGDELVDLIGTARTENTVDGLRTLGIEEYANNISIATAAYRSLTTGDSDADDAPEPGGRPMSAEELRAERLRRDRVHQDRLITKKINEMKEMGS